MLFDLISKNHAAFHHEFHPLHFRYVDQRIAGDGHQVRIFTGFDDAHLFAQSKVETFRGWAGSHLQSLRGRHAPFHVISKLEGLHAVAVGISAASEDFFHASRHQALETHFGETEARGVTAAGFQIAPFHFADQIPERLHHGPLGAIPQRLLEQADGFVVKAFGARDADDYVHRHVHARFETIAETLAAISMTGNPQAAAVRLVDDRLVFLQRERWNVDHLSIRRKRAGAGGIGITTAFVILRVVDLDPIDAIV